MPLANSALLFQAVPRLNVPFGTCIHTLFPGQYAVVSASVLSRCMCFMFLNWGQLLFHLLVLQRTVIDSYRYTVAIEHDILNNIESSCSFLSNLVTLSSETLVLNSPTWALVNASFFWTSQILKFSPLCSEWLLSKIPEMPNLCITYLLQFDLVQLAVLLWNLTVPLFLSSNF